MALAAVIQCLHIFLGVHAVSHCPQNRIGIVWIDVIIDGNANFAAVAFEKRSPIECPPNLGFGHISLQGDDGDSKKSGKRLVQGNFLHALDAQGIFKVSRKEWLISDSFDHA